MADSTQHILKMKYPACELMPRGSEFPILEVPKNVEYRDRPPQDCQKYGVYSTKFYVVLPRETMQRKVTNNQSHKGLLSAVHNLSTTPGTSTLRFVVAFDSNQQRIVHRYVIKSQTETGELQQRFDLDPVQQTVLLRLAASTAWIRMVLHLLLRESDMAWYHVMGRLLKAFPFANLEAESNDWDAEWASAVPRTPGEVLRDRIAKFNPDLDFSEIDAVRALLPCGHAQRILMSEFQYSTAKECATIDCFCGSKILTDSDRQQLATGYDFDVRRPAFLKQNLLWRKLDQRSDARTSVSYSHNTLLMALDVALESFKAPKSVIPRSLCFGYSRHAGKIVGHYKQVLGTSNHVKTSTPHDMVISLAMEAAKAVDVDDLKVRLPHILWFVSQWINRAVKFLELCRCEMADKDHQGLHQHGDRYMYSFQSWEDLEEGLDTLLGEMDLAGGVTIKAENLHEAFEDMVMCMRTGAEDQNTIGA